MTLIYGKKIKQRVDLIGEYCSLLYFGFNELDYWYNTPYSYSFNIKRPDNFYQLALLLIINMVIEKKNYNISNIRYIVLPNLI